MDFGAIEGTLESLVSEQAHPVEPNPEDAISSKLIDDAVQEALGEIPREYRAALVLSLVEGFSYREVASILSCPIGTVMSRIHRARKLLQERLRDLAEAEGIGVGEAEPNSEDGSRAALGPPPPVDLKRYRRRSRE